MRSSSPRSSVVRRRGTGPRGGHGVVLRPRPGGRFALALLALLLLAPVVDAATPPGTPIDNSALATYDVGLSVGLTSSSNTVTITTVSARTASALEFLRYAPGGAGATAVAVPTAECSASGLPAGPFGPVAPPVTSSGGAIPVPGTVDLIGTAQVPLGETLFVRVIDGDQNADAAVAEQILVRLMVAATGDAELLRLSETGPDTGEFVGYVQSSGAAAVASDCMLEALQDRDATASYVDASDAADTSTDTVTFSPVSRVFDASSGTLLSGVTVTLIDAGTGLPATVFGDDGASLFPATLVTGGSATDSSGTLYSFTPGTYRFPIVPPGTYRLDVSPTATYLHPSAVATATLQGLPGAPFSIVLGSRGEPFGVVAPSSIEVDIPLDPLSEELFLSKTTSEDVVGRGDFVQYNLRVRNPGAAAAPLGLTVTDVVPIGFRYQAGSTQIDGAAVPDPAVSLDGRTLTFTLGPVPALQNQNLRYVLHVSSAAPLGSATNRATSLLLGVAESHTATATVLVQEDLFESRSFLMGQVVVGSCDVDVTNDVEGLSGVRVYLEDGSYSVTDERGLFHFPGIAPGVHVVQMDVDTLPETHEAVACERNTRFAGRAFSQFADLVPGTVWRTDFHVAPRPPETGFVSLLLNSRISEDMADYRLEVDGAVVPVGNLRVVVDLAEGLEYVAGSSVLDGERMEDPSVSEGTLVYRIGDLSDSWGREIGLRARVPTDAEHPLVTSAFALFETPTRKSERTPVARNLSYRRSRAGSGLQFVETLGGPTGKAWTEKSWTEESVATAEILEPPSYDAVWLESASPALEWLLPEAEVAPQIPSVNVWIKHAADATPTLRRNGAEVSARNFEGRSRNSAKTAAISRWRGVDLEEGPNRFEVELRGPDGRVTGGLERIVHYAGPPVSAEWIREASIPVADGRTTPVIAVLLRDRFGRPVRKGVTGELRIDPPHESAEEDRALQVRQLAGLEPREPSYVVGGRGIAEIRLKPTSESGSIRMHLAMDNGRTASVRGWLEPEERDWILVGVGEGTLAYNVLSGNAEALDARGFEEDLQTEKRVALFAKGRVKGKWLLTIAYDSRERDEPLGESLRQVIDPDRYYTLYGSTAETRYEAPTGNKLYVKIEREQFYAMFGDYDSALDVTELARYNRSFTGLKTEYRGDRFSLSGFATETDQAFIRDEIRGDGTSGLYRLSRRGIVRNSEKITIETRDRFRSEQITRTEPQTRHLDYNIDYQAGTLFFKSPVPSKDGNLDPVFIVAEYESESGQDDSIIGGGRAAVQLLGDKLELGGSAIREGTVGRDGELLGLDLRYELDDSTRFRAEAAYTDTEGGETFGRGAAYVAELARETGPFDGRIYYRSEDPEFGLGQQSLSEIGMRKIGADARLRLTPTVSLSAEAYRQKNLETEAERDLLEARADHQRKNLNLFGGLRFARDQLDTGSDAVSQQMIAGGGYSLLDERLRLRLQSEISVGGRDENVDFPSRVILGGDLKLTPELTAFAEQEFAFGDSLEAHGTRLGLLATPWSGASLNTSVEQKMTENGARTFANLGLSQTWQVTPRWSLDAGLDRVQTLERPDAPRVNPEVPLSSGTLSDDFTALSLGSTYTADRWSLTSRIENRLGEHENKWGIFAGFYREVSDGIGYSLRLELSDVNPDEGSHENTGEIGVGFVYRPVGSRWLILDRLDLSFDHERGGAFGFRSRKIVNNINLNYRWNRRLQASFQYASKYLGETIDGRGYHGYTDLMGAELRKDLGERWDVGASFRMRHSYGADLYEPSYGVSLGCRLATNLWVSVGYNFAGFQDDEFSAAQYTSKGPFLRFRYKFDQETVKDLLRREGR